MSLKNSHSLKTDQFYDSHALDYASRTVSADMSKFHDQFLLELPRTARILDAGCGSGRDLKAFVERGYNAFGLDASPSLVEVARKYSGATCTVGRMEEINTNEKFDAIWACASLLHFSRSEMKLVLQRFRQAMFPGGIIFVSVLQGHGERVAPDGRFFSYYQESELVEIVRSSGFIVKSSCITQDTLSRSSSSDWINVLAIA